MFGALLSEAPRLSSHFYGTGESWLFSYRTGKLAVFPWTGENSCIMQGSQTELLVTQHTTYNGWKGFLSFSYKWLFAVYVEQESCRLGRTVPGLGCGWTRIFTTAPPVPSTPSTTVASARSRTSVWTASSAGHSQTQPDINVYINISAGTEKHKK